MGDVFFLKTCSAILYNDLCQKRSFYCLDFDSAALWWMFDTVLITFPKASAVQSVSRDSFNSAGITCVIVCILILPQSPEDELLFYHIFKYTACGFRVIVPASSLDIFRSVAISHSILDKSIVCSRISSYLSSSVSSSLHREAFKIFSDVKGVLIDVKYRLKHLPNYLSPFQSFCLFNKPSCHLGYFIM